MRIRFLRARRCERVQNCVLRLFQSGSRSIVLGLERLVVFFRRAILAASYAAFSMVIYVEVKDLNTISGTTKKGRRDRNGSTRGQNRNVLEHEATVEALS